MPYVGVNAPEEERLEGWYQLKRLGLMLLNEVYDVDQLRERIWEHEELQGIANEILDSGNYRFDFQFYDESQVAQILRLDFVHNGVERSICYEWKAREEIELAE